MKPMPENFVAFFTACGFFVGITFSVLSLDSAFEVIVFTVFITFLFYMLIHIAIMFFVDTKKAVGKAFKMEDYEMLNDLIIGDLDNRDRRIEHLLDKLNEEREELKKSEAKERRKNVKKRAA